MTSKSGLTSEIGSQPGGASLMSKLAKSFNFGGGTGDKKASKNIAKHLLKKAERNSLLAFKKELNESLLALE